MFTFGRTFRSRMNEESHASLAVDYDRFQELYLENTELIIESLENLKGFTRVLWLVFMQESSTLETAISKWCCWAGYQSHQTKQYRWNATGYYLERKAIFEYEAKLITAKCKNWQNANNLENYSLKET